MVLHIAKYKRKDGKLIIDHVVLLFFGFLFYVYLPFIVFSLDIFQNYGQREAYQNLDSLDIKRFLVIFFGIIVVVCVSDLRSRNIKVKPTRLGIPNITTMATILLFFLVVTLPALYNMLPSFFSQYDSSQWVRGSRGPFISFIVISITMSSMYLSGQYKFKPLNIFTFIAFLYSFLNLTTGNRGFFISLLISIVVVISQKNLGIKYKNIIVVFMIGVVFSGVIAGLRSNQLDISLASILYQVTAEGSNVATSLTLYLAKHNEQLIDFPFSLLRQFINMIPSIFFPSKFDLLVLDQRATYYLAASHFYVLLTVNFGIIGAYIFMYYLVHVLHLMKEKFRFVGIYPALCAHIPFMFFRDFELTIVKFMLEFTLLFSVIILLIGNTIKHINNKRTV